MPKRTDFTVYGGGTVYMLNPQTRAAKAWARKHLPQDALTLGPAIAVEHRYIGDIVDGIVNDGLTVGGV